MQHVVVFVCLDLDREVLCGAESRLVSEREETNLVQGI